MKKLIVGIVCFLSFTGLAHAEIIYLKDGSIVKGSIVSSNEEAMAVKTSMGEVVIKKINIDRVEYGEVKKPEEKSVSTPEEKPKIEEQPKTPRTFCVGMKIDTSLGSAVEITYFFNPCLAIEGNLGNSKERMSWETSLLFKIPLSTKFSLYGNGGFGFEGWYSCFYFIGRGNVEYFILNNFSGFVGVGFASVGYSYNAQIGFKSYLK